jgi:hypothetical protein
MTMSFEVLDNSVLPLLDELAGRHQIRLQEAANPVPLAKARRIRGEDYDPNKDPILKPRPVPPDSKKGHPQPGCMKGIIIMHDNFFEPDEDWEDYM